ncbi:MAG TPA: TetR/AcrR family transcriptional regulator [Solirubrobacteraceae bacterium]
MAELSSTRLLALAFDPDVRPADDAVSERILDAALELAAASGLKRLTMDDVASRAQVGRMTVYRRFGSHAQLVDALAVRECRRCLDRIRAALDPAEPLEERLTSLFVATLEVIREHPLLERLARVEPEALLRELSRGDSQVLALLRGFLAGLIREGQASGELAAGPEPELLAELGIRIGLSFVLLPESVLAAGDEHATREAVRALLAPLTFPG